MSGIQRYFYSYAQVMMVPEGSGDFVLYRDHHRLLCEERERVEAERETWRDAAQREGRVVAKVCRRCDEAEKQLAELREAVEKAAVEFESREDQAQLAGKQGYAYVRDTYYIASRYLRDLLLTAIDQERSGDRG